MNIFPLEILLDHEILHFVPCSEGLICQKFISCSMLQFLNLFFFQNYWQRSFITESIDKFFFYVTVRLLHVVFHCSQGKLNWQKLTNFLYALVLFEVPTLSSPKLQTSLLPCLSLNYFRKKSTRITLCCLHLYLHRPELAKNAIYSGFSL